MRTRARHGAGLATTIAIGALAVACDRGEQHDGFPFAGDTEAPATTGDASGTDGDTSGVIPSEDDATGEGGSSGEPSPPECGNGVVEDGEECDGDAYPGDLSCGSLGFDDGALSCADACGSYSTAGCFSCGNGTLEGPETCEVGLPVATCEGAGFTEGTATCDIATCQVDTSQCSLCGDDTVTGTELCDGTDLGGDTCGSIGFSAGDLACTTDSCRYDVTGCSGGAWSDDFEAGDLGAAYATGGTQPFVVTGTNPINGSFSAHCGDINDSQTSSLQLTSVFSEAGTIAFTQRVSTESGWDYLQFYIDGALQGSWSGSGSDSGESYPVAAGEHVFEWRYVKDGSLSSGSDTVWVDDITLTGGVAF